MLAKNPSRWWFYFSLSSELTVFNSWQQTCPNCNYLQNVSPLILGYWVKEHHEVSGLVLEDCCSFSSDWSFNGVVHDQDWLLCENPPISFPALIWFILSIFNLNDNIDFFYWSNSWALGFWVLEPIVYVRLEETQYAFFASLEVIRCANWGISKMNIIWTCC